MARKLTVLGIGNEDMGDDAVGVFVARELLARAPRVPAEVVDGGMRGMGLLRYFCESDVLLVVDAIDAGTEPGAVFRFDPDAAGVTQLRSNNIHGMGVPYLLTNARLLGHKPRVIVYAVQVGDVNPNREELTPEVRASADAVIEMIIDELTALDENAEAV